MTLPCAGVAACGAIKGVGPGDTVVIQGIGGISLFTLQRAKSAGARAIATTFSDVKANRLMGLGADGGAAGIVTVRFTLDRRGGVRASEIVASSGARTMDQAALSQLKEVAPFPRPHATAPWRTRDFTVRLDFRAL